MAIIVEEEKNKGGIVRILMWVVILGIVGFAGYYIFFAKPQLVEIEAPANFKGINPLSEIQLNPQEVIQGRSFQALKNYVSPPQPGNAGKSNPFAPL